MAASQYAPMPPVFGPGVAIEDGLVVLRWRQRHDVAAVAQRDEADFFAAQKLLDHQPAPSVASAGFGLGAVARDHHALARRQAVGLQDHRKSEAVERAARIGFVVRR